MIDSPSLIAHVNNLILTTFDASAEVAHDHACGLVTVAEGWGGDDVVHLDWDQIIKKRLEATLNWRSVDEKNSHFQTREVVFESYERYIQQQRRSSNPRPF